ncbi:hypothetical protein [Kribbella sp. NPDC050470]|uniref:hypothetical protein n=1 Tax=unclassified Kribbella TaxID=2644121 RepID=UPI0037AB5DBC
MTQFQQHPAEPQQPRKKPMSKEARIGWSILAGLVIFTFGIGIGAGGNSSNPAPVAAGDPAPTVTVSVPGEPGAEVTVTAPPVTVTKPAPAPKTVTAQPPQAAAAITEDGTYEVGVDIKPGKYKSAGGDSCYWARLKNLDGDLDAIIANNISDGPQTVVIKKTDKGFETNRCGTWTKVG